MLFVIAIGGNALLQRDQPLEAKLLERNIKKASYLLGEFSKKHDVVIVHGNGPQIGLLALQTEAYKKVKPYPLDILGAETQGMIGYLLQQQIQNHAEKKTITLLTQVLIDPNDIAFKKPSKFIGPVYDQEIATKLHQQHQWLFKADNEYLRRVVASPKPQKIIEIAAIKTLLRENHIVIAGGGGGIPCIENNSVLQGVEAVVDKDLTAMTLARQLHADHLVILTDVEYVYRDWGTPQQSAIKKSTITDIQQLTFPKGSMQPKISAAIEFTYATKQSSYIGNLFKLPEILSSKSGTQITV